MYVSFHVLSLLGMGAAAWLGVLALGQAWVLRRKLNLVMVAYVRLMAVEVLLATAYCLASLLSLADRRALFLHGGR